ncbi:sensor histidine kinase [Phytoactinopolyspora halotolerans]|uniref:histidine kinase n=1 Tax=Phytoactinopolyspora halotolerans TaxID=1981512 RepID=A0A6L9SD72_9ACTN|nr:sensor histidine kinase [Phytoactinopolyspora halotolerans]NEE03196.1 sensor histidine kinase [Phytoactinopolyspora halotolerans]
MSDAVDHQPRVKPVVFDGALVVLLIALGVVSMVLYADLSDTYRDPDLIGAVLTVLNVSPLLFRRTHPAFAGLLVAGTTTGYLLWDYASMSVTVAMLVAVYSAGAYARLDRGLAVVVAHLAVTVTYVAQHSEDFGPRSAAALNLTFAAFGYAGLWAFGRAMQRRRRYTSELEDRAYRLERTRDAEVRVALAEERSRIARELHDVVAHHVSVMTVQAAGARRAMQRDPQRSGDALQSIEDTGRAALAEMRRIVDLLRSPDRSGRLEPAGSHRGPQPGVGDLETLVEQMRAAGVSVDLTVEPGCADLPAGVDVTIFRIVQEALTNTLKHAGPSSAEVRLARDGDAITVAVCDDGRGIAAELDGHQPGLGLVGLRERVTLYGGKLAVGPRRGGGYQVRAWIPVDYSEHSAVPS